MKLLIEYSTSNVTKRESEGFELEEQAIGLFFVSNSFFSRETFDKKFHFVTKSK